MCVLFVVWQLRLHCCLCCAKGDIYYVFSIGGAHISVDGCLSVVWQQRVNICAWYTKGEIVAVNGVCSVADGFSMVCGCRTVSRSSRVMPLCCLLQPENSGLVLQLYRPCGRNTRARGRTAVCCAAATTTIPRQAPQTYPTATLNTIALRYGNATTSNRGSS